METLKTINGLLTDAQEKQISREDVKKWFDDVQELLYEAEDLLDEIHCEDRRLHVEYGCRSRSNKIQNFFSSLLTFNREDNIKVKVENLKKIFGKIKELEKQGLGLGLTIIEEQPRSLWWTRLGLDSRDHGEDSTLSDMKSRYSEFPSGLKRCFVYCVVFPKGYNFRREELVLLWLANGFLDFPDFFDHEYPLSHTFKEKIGSIYFQVLVQSSFFVKVSDHPPSFILNDLIHDWGKLMSGNYCVSLDDGDSLSTKTRHISCLSSIRRYEDLANLMRNTDGDRMRTILPISNECFWKDFNDEEIDSLMLTFKRLRVLSLSNIHELPDSIGSMGHLRYLNLSGAAVKRIPEPVCSLFNLQTLILRQCRDLVELPANIVKLTDLCHLDIRETRLQQMPPHFGELRNLEMLTDFFVGEQIECSIYELGKLERLQGELHVWNLQHVSDALKEGFLNRRSFKELRWSGSSAHDSLQDVTNALNLGFLNRCRFKELELRWSGSGADDSLLQQHVLKELRPHTDVKRLSIIGYGGKEFPDWVGHTSFSKLVDLKLSECHYCSSLPPLGQLSSLKTLVVQAFYRVEKVGPEFYGSSTSTRNPFRALKNLTFERMLQWCEWESYADEDEDRAFPRLEALCIRKCPNLANKTLPIHLPSLVELEITKCRRLELPLSGLPPIDKIVLGDDFHKMALDHRLQSLVVDSFHSLDSILEEIQQWGYSCSTLQKIEITRSPLKSFPPKLFPELKQLDISKCPNLESLCAQHLTSLERLAVRECPKLKSMPGESLPSSLISLSIKSCPLLKQRCQRNIGGVLAQDF